MAIIWSDSAPYPELCDYCDAGCQCGSPNGLSAEAVFAGETPWKCNFCQFGCQCGAEEWKKPGDGGWDRRPVCECECNCCNCECECEDYLIDADSYNQWVRESCYTCDPECLDSVDLSSGQKIFCMQELGGGYQFQIKLLPTHVKVQQSLFGMPIGPKKTIRSTLEIFLGLRRATCMFTGPVMIPMLLGPTNAEKPLWMSLTPMEVFSLRPGIKRAKGRVLIAGLGLGWMTNQILKKKDVRQVTQVEICPEVARFFGDPLLQMYPDKFEIVIGNIWQLIQSNQLDLSRYDQIIFDIWPQFGTAHMDRSFKKLKADYPRKVWGWGDH